MLHSSQPPWQHQCSRFQSLGGRHPTINSPSTTVTSKGITRLGVSLIHIPSEAIGNSRIGTVIYAMAILEATD